MRRLPVLLIATTALCACSPDHTYRPKPVDAGPEDVGAVDVGPELDGWWTAEPDRCGPDELRSGLEHYAPPAPPAELGEVPRVLWRTNRMCYGEATDRIRGESAYGPLTIDGVTEPRLAVMHYTYRGQVLEPNPELVVTLNAHTGQDEHCVDLTSEETSTAPFLLLDPALGLYYIAYEFYQEGPVASLFTAGPQPPDTFLPYGFQHRGTSIFVGQWVLSQQGQVLTPVSNRVLVSNDALTGQRLWAKDLRTDWNVPFVHPDTVGVLTGVYHAAPDEVLVFVAAQQRNNSIPESGLFPVNVCGELGPEVYHGGQVHNLVRLANGDHVGLTQERWGDPTGLATWKDWKITYSVEACDTFVVLSDERVACLLWPTSTHPSGELQLHDFEGEPLTVPLGPPATAFSRWLVAGAGDVLIAYGEWRDDPDEREPEGWHGGLLFIRPPYDEVEFVELHLPNRPGGGNFGPPLVAPDGILYVDFGDYLYAVQTDIFGLARSVYPRSGRGGNANRGHVVLDP